MCPVRVLARSVRITCLSRQTIRCEELLSKHIMDPECARHFESPALWCEVPPFPLSAFLFCIGHSSVFDVQMRF